MQNELLGKNVSHLGLNQTIINFIQFIRSEYSFKLDRKTKLRLCLTLAALITFGIGGFLATTANLMRTFQFDFLDIGVLLPLIVILVYLSLTATFTVYGSVIDNRTKKKGRGYL